MRSIRLETTISPGEFAGMIRDADARIKEAEGRVKEAEEALERACWAADSIHRCLRWVLDPPGNWSLYCGEDIAGYIYHYSDDGSLWCVEVVDVGRRDGRWYAAEGPVSPGCYFNVIDFDGMDDEDAKGVVEQLVAKAWRFV